MPVNLSQYRGTVGLFNNEFIPKKQSNIFYCAFFRNSDILAITSVLFSIFIYDRVMSSVKNGLFYTLLLLRSKYKSINSFVSRGLCLHVSNIYALHLGLFNLN